MKGDLPDETEDTEERGVLFRLILKKGQFKKTATIFSNFLAHSRKI